MKEWYQLDASTVARHLQSDCDTGLSDGEPVRRRSVHGLNRLVETGGRSVFLILWEQLSGALVIMLIAAAGVSLYLGELKDAVVITIIIVLNALLGFVQDFRAERAMAALRQLAVPTVRVLRNGKRMDIQATELVPGDIIFLETGNIVAADCRVIENVNLRVQEAALTGESEPVEKISDALPSTRLSTADRTNMLFMGTTVSYGRGRAIVTATGMRTELGQIATMLQSVDRDPTPLQRRLAHLGRRLATAALLIVAVVFFLGLFRGESPRLMFMTALSLAVAAVPEGLPAVATVALALGARKMLRRNALIRKLPAVETLGSVTVICSDKTGTLTQNRMTVEVLDAAHDYLELMAPSRDELSTATSHDNHYLAADHAGLALLVAAGSLCNDASLESDEQPGDYRASGDPTEGALVIAAARAGMLKTDLERVYERVGEVPFDADRKRMTTIHRAHGDLEVDSSPVARALSSVQDGDVRFVAFTKGAVDSVLAVSSKVWVNEHAEPLDKAWRERIEVAQNRLADRGMRVIGVAFRPLSRQPLNGPSVADEHDLTFVGMTGMIDPPRPEVKHAVARCKSAGIRYIMITGDHPRTAKHIADGLGIPSQGRTLTGEELDRMSIAELKQVAKDVSIFARVSPEHKLKIVQALQSDGEIVAMTGDGVNDAPALKKADIGVAMGITGTDVAKEAADAVLLDDNFSTIVGAVEEGRIIFDNIRKFVKYTMTSNAGEIWLMLLAPFLGMPLPLIPLQILWINLVTDGLPGLALAVEPGERDTMQRPPYPPNQNVIDRPMTLDIVWIGLLMGVISLGAGYFYWQPVASDNSYFRTIIFTVLTLSQMGNALALRASRDSVFQIGLFSNPLLVAAVGLTFALQMAVIYLPAFQDIFATAALSVRDLLYCLALSTAVFWAIEMQKYALRRRRAARIQAGRTAAHPPTS